MLEYLVIEGHRSRSLRECMGLNAAEFQNRGLEGRLDEVRQRPVAVTPPAGEQPA